MEHKAVPVGGLTIKKLQQATAAESDVLNGKTFYAGDRELKTGTGQVYTYVNKVSSAAVTTDTYTLPAGTYKLQYIGGGYYSTSSDHKSIELYINDTLTDVTPVENIIYNADHSSNYMRWFDRYIEFTLTEESDVYFVYPKKDGHWQIFISVVLYKIA